MMRATPTYVLVAENFSGRASEDDLLARLGDAVTVVEHTVRTDKDRTIPGLRITLLAGFHGLRNTAAHGMAVASGFIAHVE